MNDLERQVQELKAQLSRLEERVRLDATAERFIAGNHEIRERDFVKFSDGHAARILSIENSVGKWTYLDRNGRIIEPFRVPPEDGIERLYTIEEVGEILTKSQEFPNRKATSECRRYSDRAQAYCILPTDHDGDCRFVG